MKFSHFAAMHLRTGLVASEDYNDSAVNESTSQIFDKVLQLHLPLRLDIGAVHVSVEEDDGKGQNEDGVWVPELAHHTRVADAVALTGMQRQKINA